MIKMDGLGAKIDEKEVTAFIQQQMLDLSPHLTDKAALQVRLSKRTDGFEVELTAFQEEGEIQTVGVDNDIFDAIRNAKEGLMTYFVEVEEESNPHLRDSKIDYLSKHGSLYLH